LQYAIFSANGSLVFRSSSVSAIDIPILGTLSIHFSGIPLKLLVFENAFKTFSLSFASLGSRYLKHRLDYDSFPKQLIAV